MPNIVRFDCFELDLDAGELRKHHTKVRLRDQSLRVLATLVENPGSVVTRDVLRHLLWNREIFVDFDNNLNIIIARLRDALGDSADHPRYIETLPKRGYRFLANVSDSAYAAAHPARLVVLPFVNLTGESGQDYLGDVVTDEMITSLASLAPDQLKVIARTTSMHYKGTRKDAGRIGRELNAEYIVEGGIRREQDIIWINVQLIQASDQTHLFARRYETRSGELYCVQTAIAREIATQLPMLAGNDRAGSKFSRATTENLTAYSEYIQGRQHMARATPDDFNVARRKLEGAIARDPHFALAHDALAELHWYFGYFGFTSPRNAFSAGILHALRALEIDDTRAETHALLAQFHKTLEYDWSEVHREMSLALELDPRSPLVRMRYAISELMPHGRVEEAAAELQRALEYDPLSHFTRFWLGIMLLFCRRHERAIEEAEKILENDPNFFLAYFVLSAGCRYKGLIDKAIAAQRKCVSLSGGAAVNIGWLGLTLATSGEEDEARDLLDQLRSLAEKSYVPPTCFAWIHLGLRELDVAFEWLERAVENCDQLMMPIKSYAFFDPIRSDRRFNLLLRRMHLE